VSWSAFQAFVLVAGDTLPNLTIILSNGVFIAVGAACLATHVAFVALGALNGIAQWK
jgi:hypothetical protein